MLAIHHAQNAKTGEPVSPGPIPVDLMRGMLAFLVSAPAGLIEDGVAFTIGTEDTQAVYVFKKLEEE